MSFMRPEVYHGKLVVVDPGKGDTFSVEYSIFDRSERAALDALIQTTDKVKQLRLVEVPRSLQSFLGKRVLDVKILDGWIGYATADGYLDRTEANLFDSEAEAWNHAREAAGGEE